MAKLSVALATAKEDLFAIDSARNRAGITHTPSSNIDPKMIKLGIS